MKNSDFICDCNIVHKELVENTKEAMNKEKNIDRLSDLFKTIGDPTRARILFALDKNELCVCDICNILNMTKSAISHQLAKLRKADLVKFRKDGKTVYYSLNDNHIKVIFETAIEHLTHINIKESKDEKSL